MAGEKISELPAATAATLTDLIPAVQGSTKKETLQQVLNLFQSNIQITESQVTNLTSDLASKLTAANNLSDLTNDTTARTNLGLGTLATQDASNVLITGGNVNGLSSLSTTGGLFSVDSTGEITAGIWNGSTIPVGFGGTGATTFTSHGVLYGNGTSAIGVTASGSIGTVLLGNGASFPSFGNNIDGDFSVISNLSGSTRRFTTGNSATTSGSDACISAQTEGASGGDAYFLANIAGVTNWAFGADNSDSDAFVISANPSPGTNNALRIDPITLGIIFNGNVSIGSTSTTSLFNVGTTNQFQIGTAGTVSSTADATFTSSTSGIQRTLTVSSTSNTASAGSVVDQRIAGTTSSTCFHRWSNTGQPESYALGYVPSTRFLQLCYDGQANANPSGGTLLQVIDHFGNFTYPNQTNFLTYYNTQASNVTGDGTIYTFTWGTSLWDNGANILGTTFTANTTAKYIHQINVGLTGLTSSHTAIIVKFITSNRTYQVFAGNPWNMSNNTGNLLFSCGTNADFDANDTATWTIQISNGTKVVSVFGVTGTDQRSWWSGKNIG